MEFFSSYKNVLAIFLVPLLAVAITILTAINAPQWHSLAWFATLLTICGLLVVTWLYIYARRVVNKQADDITTVVQLAAKTTRKFFTLLLVACWIDWLALAICCIPIYFIKPSNVVFLGVIILLPGLWRLNQLTKIYNNNMLLDNEGNEGNEGNEDNVLNAILATSENAPLLHAELTRLSQSLNFSMPDYILIGMEPDFWVNADLKFRLNDDERELSGSVLHLSLMGLAILSKEDLSFILKHEFGHLKIIAEANKQGIDYQLFKRQCQFIYDWSNTESPANYFFNPVVALSRHFIRPLKLFEDKVEFYADNYLLFNDYERLQAARTLLWYSSTQRECYKIIGKFESGAIAKELSPVAAIYKHFSSIDVTTLVDQYLQPPFIDKDMLKRIDALGVAISECKEFTPILKVDDSALKYLTSDIIKIVEDSFIKSIESYHDDMLETLQTMADKPTPTKEKAFRYSGGIKGIGFLSVAIIIGIVLDASTRHKPFSEWINLSLEIVMYLLLFTALYLFIKCWRSYLILKPSGILVMGKGEKFFIAWQQIIQCKYLQNRLVFTLAEPVINNPRKLAKGWYLSTDGYCLSFYPTSLADKKIDLLLTYYSIDRARRELAQLIANQWFTKNDNDKQDK